MRFVLTAACLACAALPARADYWEYRDWRVFVETVDTGEDLRRTCTALTGGDGMPSLRLSVSNGDAGPPYDYPAPTYHETAPRHYPTAVANGAALAFVFDTDAIFYALADGVINAEGLAELNAAPRWQDTLAMLQTMRAAQSTELFQVNPFGAGHAVGAFSMSGFTAAYGKMMDECGFSIALD